ncbi:MAG: capsid protein VP2 [candidate division WOR-3 bacterium]
MKKWIQKAIKRKGRVRKFIKRLYGKKAFLDGIKLKYLNKAINYVKKSKKIKHKRSLLSALYLAKRLKKMRRKR